MNLTIGKSLVQLFINLNYVILLFSFVIYPKIAAIKNKILVANNQVKKAVVLNIYGNIKVKRKLLLIIIEFDRLWYCTTIFKIILASPNILIFILINNN